MRKPVLSLVFPLLSLQTGFSQAVDKTENKFQVSGFHLDLTIQVMPMPALKEFAKKLSESGINALIRSGREPIHLRNIPLF